MTTTKELIEKLQMFPPDMPVFVCNYQDDSNENLEPITIEGVEKIQADSGEEFLSIYFNMVEP